MTEPGRLLAMDMATGKERWRVTIGDYVTADTASLLVYQGVVVLALPHSPLLARGESGLGVTASSNILGLSAQDGSLLWNFEPDTPVFNFLASATQDSVVFMDFGGGVYRVQVVDGSLVWKFPGTNQFSTGAAVIGENDVIYAVHSTALTINQKVDSMGVMQAFRFSDGRLLWQRLTGDFLGNKGPAVGFLQGDRQGHLSVVAALGYGPSDATPTRPNLQKLMSWFPEFAKPFVWKVLHRLVPESVFLWLAPVFPVRGRIVAVDAETGETQWVFTTPLWTLASANGDSRRFKDRIAAHTENRRMDWECWPDAWATPTITGDGTVYAGFQDGHLYSIRDNNNDGDISADEVSVFKTEDAWLGTLAVAPGLLVGAPCGGGLYAFKG